MQPPILPAFLGFPGSPFWMFASGIALLVIGVVAAKNDIARAQGIGKIVVLNYLCVAIPLAVFGAEHFSPEKLLLTMVPSYMPWRLFWLYFVGSALIAAALSIATRIQVRWSGLLLAIMMFLFVVMLYLPGALTTGSRLAWTVAIREASFGGAGLVLAGIAMGGNRNARGRVLIAVGRVLIAIAAIFFGLQHFLHPLGLPVVPLEKQMPAWVPAGAVVGYVTGAILILAGACFLLGWKTGPAATYLGAWILLLVVVIYGPVLIGALLNPNAGEEIEGLSYFADTLLFGGVILSLARAMGPDTAPSNFVSGSSL